MTEPRLGAPHFIHAEHAGIGGYPFTDWVCFQLFVAGNYLCEVVYQPDDCAIFWRDDCPYKDSARPDRNIGDMVNQVKYDIITTIGMEYSMPGPHATKVVATITQLTKQ